LAAVPVLQAPPPAWLYKSRFESVGSTGDAGHRAVCVLAVDQAEIGLGVGDGGRKLPISRRGRDHMVGLAVCRPAGDLGRLAWWITRGRASGAGDSEQRLV